MPLIWKLLRRHISIGQLTGFFLASLFGMSIVLLGFQLYRDLLPLFTQGDSIMKKNYIVATKKINLLSGLAGRGNSFSRNEIEELEAQPFTRRTGAFTPSMFKVTASLGMPQSGIQLSTEMFFESVPDDFVDVSLKQWKLDEGTRTIPIIIPRSYLNLYNFGFAQSRGLPKLSEGLMGLIQMDIVLRGNGRTEAYKGNIVGFSNRLNTILVPQSFMEQANLALAPQKKAAPSRLIIEVDNPADPAIADYFKQKNYDTEGDNLDAGRTTYFLRLVAGIVIGVGLVICLLSLYILMLSIFLLLQKNTSKLEGLLLIGYSPARVALPYHLLTAGLNLLVLLLALGGVVWARGNYLPALQNVFPQLESNSPWPAIGAGCLLFLAVSLLNMAAIRKKIHALLR